MSVWSAHTWWVRSVYQSWHLMEFRLRRGATSNFLFQSNRSEQLHPLLGPCYYNMIEIWTKRTKKGTRKTVKRTRIVSLPLLFLCYSPQYIAHSRRNRTIFSVKNRTKRPIHSYVRFTTLVAT